MKLTNTEENAKLLCDWIKNGIRKGIVIEWRKSRTWGMNPHISLGDERECVRVSGCGYCKESTALAHCLCWLFEPDTESHKDVSHMAWVGVSSVADELAKARLEARGRCGRQKQSRIQRHKNLVETGATRSCGRGCPQLKRQA